MYILFGQKLVGSGSGLLLEVRTGTVFFLKGRNRIRLFPGGWIRIRLFHEGRFRMLFEGLIQIRFFLAGWNRPFF